MGREKYRTRYPMMPDSSEPRIIPRRSSKIMLWSITVFSNAREPTNRLIVKPTPHKMETP